MEKNESRKQTTNNNENGNEKKENCPSYFTSIYVPRQYYVIVFAVVDI